MDERDRGLFCLEGHSKVARHLRLHDGLFPSRSLKSVPPEHHAGILTAESLRPFVQDYFIVSGKKFK